MKKFLSLVLALVMAMSLVTISAGATEYKDLTDKSTITYTEAVQVMNKLGIISGYTDGAFKPTATLTRGAAAKIIAYLNLGTDAANALICDSAPYKDVKASDTFAPFIAYCKNAKLIDGYADGTFKAGNTLTGYQFAKMLLTSLGYDSASESFTGSNWSVNVAKLAVNNKLFKGNSSFVGTKVVTREEACLYAFNTLLANEVTYPTSGTTIITSDGTKIVTGGATATAKTSASDSNTIYDETTGAASTTNLDVVQFAEDHFAKLSLNTYIRDGRTGRDFSYNGTAFSTFVGTDTVLATSTDGTALAKLIDNTNTKYVGYAIDTYAKLYVNGAGQTGATASAPKTSSDYSYSELHALTTYDVKGYIIQFIDTNSNGKYDVVRVTEKSVATLSAAPTTTTSGTTTSVTVSGVSGLASIPTSRVAGYEGLAKGDVVLFYTYSYGGNTYYVLNKCATASGVATSKSSSNAVTFGGTTYSQSGLTGTTYAAASFADYKNTYTLYLDDASNIVKVTKTTSISGDYAYVLQTAWVAASGEIGSSAYAQAQLLMPDGTAKIVTASKVDGSTIVASGASTGEVNYAANLIAGKFVTYSIDSKGKYELTNATDASVDMANATASGSISNNTASYVTGAVGNASTVYLVETGTSSTPVFTAYIGIANVPGTSGSVTVNYLKNTSTGMTVYAFFDARGTSLSGTVGEFMYLVPNADGNLVYTTYPADTTNNVPAYREYNAVVNGVATTVKLADTNNVIGSTYNATTANAAAAKSTLYKVINKDTNGIVSLANVVDPSKTFTGVSVVGGTMVVGGSTAYMVTDDTAVYYITTKGVSTQLVPSAVVTDDNDTVFIAKTSSDGKTAETVYVLQVNNVATMSAVTYTYGASSTQASQTISATGNVINASMSAADVVTITSVTTTTGATYAVSGTCTVAATAAGASSSNQITITLLAEDGTTAGTPVVLTFAVSAS